uniref:Uncharacterized protein n=1 Tax=Fusarium oxysporum (strain Fo5176) TaxID=660025 RepID=A0A0D2YJK1_FUSOF
MQWATKTLPQTTMLQSYHSMSNRAAQMGTLK